MEDGLTAGVRVLHGQCPIEYPRVLELDAVRGQPGSESPGSCSFDRRRCPRSPPGAPGLLGSDGCTGCLYPSGRTSGPGGETRAPSAYGRSALAAVRGLARSPPRGDPGHRARSSRSRLRPASRLAAVRVSPLRQALPTRLLPDDLSVPEHHHRPPGRRGFPANALSGSSQGRVGARKAQAAKLSG